MHFCFTANYTPQALEAMKNSTTSRQQAIEKLLEAAGGKLTCFFHTIDEGPGAIAIFEAEPKDAMAMTALIASSGAVHNMKFRRLATSDEVRAIRERRRELQEAYAAPGQ